jgi:hypothetical protein
VTLAAVETRLKSHRGFVALWLVGTGAVAVAALLMYWGGLPGWDDAAHVYKVFLIREGQSVFWDNYWYGGGYGAITYGFVFYWLAQFVPAKLIVVLAAGALPPLYYVYQRDMWRLDDVWPAWLLAAVMVAYLAHGQDPFLLALALTVGGLALLARGHPLWAALPVVIGVFVNPMGFVVAATFMIADVLGRPGVRRRYVAFAAAAAPFLLIRVALGWAFAEPGAYLNQTSQLLIYLGFALTGVALAGVNAVHPRRPFVILFLAYAGICLISFVTPGSPLGNNTGRFFMVFGLPMLFLLRHTRLQRPFPYGDLAVVPIVLFALLQFSSPVSHFVSSAERPQTQRSFFAPALALAARTYDLDHRIHVVALRRHWEADYFPEAGYPITRGWYRQADAIHNSFFYEPYDAATYTAWLRRMGVEYVFLADAPLDTWSRREAHILATSKEFEVVDHAGAWTVYRLRHAEPLVVGLDGGTGHVVWFGHRALTLSVDRPGSYLIKVTWSPYWTLTGGAGELHRAPGRFLSLDAEQAGRYRLSFDVTLGKALAEVGDKLGL